MAFFNEIPKRGRSAYEVAVKKGFVGTIDEWLASLKGEKGDKGDRGEVGPIGRTSTVKIGKVRLGKTINVENSGTDNDAVLDFTLPIPGEDITIYKGDPGERGVDGKSAYEIACEGGFEGTEEEWVKSLAGPRATVSQTAVEVIGMLRASAWKDDCITILGDAIKKTSELVLSISNAAEYEQYVAMDKANLVVVSQEDGSATYKAFGPVPSIDVPFRLVVKNLVNIETNAVSLVAGPQGAPGPRGKSAYETAQDNGYTGTQEEWLQTLVGPKAEIAVSSFNLDVMLKSSKWTSDNKYVIENSAIKANAFMTLAPAASISAQQFNAMTNAQIICTSQSDGTLALRAINGAPAIDIPAVVNIMTIVNANIQSTPIEVLQGPSGKSAYEVAKDNGFNGTEAEWLESLKGKSELTPEDVESIKDVLGEYAEKIKSLDEEFKDFKATYDAIMGVGEDV